ncbi:hypothetical protein ACP70R_027454 [Stipagrostis hirtigluma subsp. patula]
MSENLSDDIIINILAWLPLKEVARMRVVCKRWNSLTLEQHFLCTSFSRNTNHSIVSFFLKDSPRCNVSYVPLPEDTVNNHHITPDLSFIPSTPATDKGQIYVTASCSGLLICCRPNISISYKSTWYVCNPLTRKFMELEVPEGIARFLALAYDPTRSRHYKIIAFGKYNIQMYSSQTRSWRIALHFDRLNHPFRGLHCNNNNVYWCGSLVYVVRNSLMCFVVDEERVVEMPMPQTPKGWICAYVGTSSGFLHMIGFTEEERLGGVLDVLELQEGSVEWSVLYRVDLRKVIELYPGIQRTRPEFQYFGLRSLFGTGKMIDFLALCPMYVVRGMEERARLGQLLFSIPGKIMSYHTENHKFSTVHGDPVAPKSHTNQFQWYQFHPYNPSLFAL